MIQSLVDEIKNIVLCNILHDGKTVYVLNFDEFISIERTRIMLTDEYIIQMINRF